MARRRSVPIERRYTQKVKDILIASDWTGSASEVLDDAKAFFTEDGRLPRDFPDDDCIKTLVARYKTDHERASESER